MDAKTLIQKLAESPEKWGFVSEAATKAGVCDRAIQHRIKVGTVEAIKFDRTWLVKLETVI